MEQVLPFYVVCDESYSMLDNIDALNDGLRELHTAVGSDPVVADKTRFGVIGFSDDAEILLELSDLSEVTQMQGLAVKGGTNYGAAFKLLRQTIDGDVAKLKQDGCRVYRPVAFFLSDGQPNYDWKTDYDALIDPTWKARPNIVAFGFGDVDHATIADIGTFKSFVADNSISPGAALHEFAGALTKSIVQSGTNMKDGEVNLQVPDEVPGFTQLKAEEL
ncbi:vWA domain-containing protein [Glycomyces buryatensis]|uniref:VWA domain-containing protein n=1 Tax=Glycomyces buryatensis TaxID=2570927 RepID=A0A4S8QPD3_9ACTN|nr:VWA domain-containing protein [Glycomyces buryatensis]THV43279.1 VWA domain-containing protein [Glycomyces buryatensis]